MFSWVVCMLNLCDVVNKNPFMLSFVNVFLQAERGTCLHLSGTETKLCEIYNEPWTTLVPCRKLQRRYFKYLRKLIVDWFWIWIPIYVCIAGSDLLLIFIRLSWPNRIPNCRSNRSLQWGQEAALHFEWIPTQRSTRPLQWGQHMAPHLKCQRRFLIRKLLQSFLNLHHHSSRMMCYLKLSMWDPLDFFKPNSFGMLLIRINIKSRNSRTLLHDFELQHAKYWHDWESSVWGQVELPCTAEEYFETCLRDTSKFMQSYCSKRRDSDLQVFMFPCKNSVRKSLCRLSTAIVFISCDLSIVTCKQFEVL